jgi:hypothetical protein
VNRISIVLFVAALCACENKSTSPPAPSASAATASAAPSAIAPAASASAAPSASAQASEKSAWSGTYKSALGTVTLPVGKTYEGASWKNDDGAAGVGEGTISIDVDDAGIVSGSGQGVLGAFVIDGVVKDGQLSAKITRKDPSDRGFTGTVVGKVAGDRIEGTMSLALPEASGVRKATFSLAKK